MARNCTSGAYTWCSISEYHRSTPVPTSRGYTDSLSYIFQVSAKGSLSGFLRNHLVGAYGGGGVPGTPYLSTVTCCILLIFCLLEELLAELLVELGSELTVELTSELISEQVVDNVAELVADVDGVDGCDWSISILHAAADRRRDGLSLMASS